MNAPYPLDWNAPLYPGGNSGAVVPYPFAERGHLLVMNMVANGSPVVPPPDEGWIVKHFDSPTATALAYKWATGNEGANTGAWTGASYYHMWMFRINMRAYPGALPTHDPFVGPIQYGVASGANSTPLSLTTLEADNLLLFFEGNFTGDGMIGNPAGMTGWYADPNYVHAAYEYQHVAGSSGTKQATFSSAGGDHFSLLYALKGHVPDLLVDGVKHPAKSISTIHAGVKRTGISQYTTKNQGHLHPQ